MSGMDLGYSQTKVAPAAGIDMQTLLKKISKFKITHKTEENSKGGS
jgi:hypothetical protein